MRIIFLFVAFLSLSYSNYVNKVVADVNGAAITSLDVKNEAIKFSLSKKNALDKIIIDTIKKSLISSFHINISTQEVDEHLKKIAQSNNLSILELKNEIQKNESLIAFMNKIKIELRNDKFFNSILREQNFFINNKDLLLYFNKNQDLFYSYSSIRMIEYSSRSRYELLQAKNSPLSISDKVRKKKINVKFKTLNPNMKQIIRKTKENRFSEISKINNMYIMFYISNKKNPKIQSFAKVKNNIYNYLFTKRKNKIIVNYLSKKKLEANINIF